MLFDNIVPRDPERPGPAWLDAASVTFSVTPGGILRAELADRCYRHVVILRCLPLTVDDEYLSVRCNDEEVGIIAKLTDLSPEQRELVEAEIDQRYFRPRLLRVKSIVDQSGIFYWTTETDRGHVEFSARHPRHSVHRAGDGRWIVTDLDNNRYEIVESQLQDSRSARLLDQALA